ncbi:MAG: GAF domain-containing protein [Cyanobacteriota bacterium]|nr:GAF domain-containing protein [Cyanobacteriota bacterium]
MNLCFFLTGWAILHYGQSKIQQLKTKKQPPDNQQFSNILSAITDAFISLDKNWCFVYLNPQAEKLLQRSRDSLLGKNVWQEFPEAAGSIFQFNYERAMQEQVIVKFDSYYEPLKTWFEVDAYPSPEQLVIYFRDVSHRKQLEDLLKQQIEREKTVCQVIQAIRGSHELSTAFSVTISAMAQVFEVDLVSIVKYDSGIKYWESVVDYIKQADESNSSSYILSEQPIIFGYDNPLAEQIKRFETLYLPDLSQQKDSVNQFLAQRFPGSWLIIPLQVEGSLWGSLSMSRSKTNAWSEEDIVLSKTFAQQLSITIDYAQVYERLQRANDELRYQVEERNASLRRALDFEMLSQVISDEIRNTLDENQILETVVKELALSLGLNSCGIAIPNWDQQTYQISHEYAQRPPALLGGELPLELIPFKQIQRGESVIYTLNHPHHGWITKLSCPIQDEKQLLAVLCLARNCDSTFNEQEFRLAQQIGTQCGIAIRQARLYQASQNQVSQLQKLNQLKDDFLSMGSHELRGPLTNMQMALKMMQLANTDEKKQTYYGMALKECSRQIELINDLLDLNKLESDSYELNIQPVDIADWIQPILDGAMLLGSSKQLRFTTHLAENLPSIYTDSSGLNRILKELLNNAVKYTPPDGEIKLEVLLTEPNIQFIVRNSSAIEAKLLNRIFERFYRIPNSDPQRQGGTGLGLPLVKELVKQLQGSLEVFSNSGWTSFVVKLPIGQPAPENFDQE